LRRLAATADATDFALVATGRASFRLVPAPGRDAVHLDPVRGVVRTAPGVELDLGATAKALAADRAARAAAAAAKSPVLVGLGGDIAVAGAPPASSIFVAGAALVWRLAAEPAPAAAGS